jgi:hypothetical protein
MPYPSTTTLQDGNLEGVGNHFVWQDPPHATLASYRAEVMAIASYIHPVRK